MMSFEEIINDHLLSKDKDCDSPLLIPAISTSSSNFLIAINQMVVKIPDLEEKRKLQKAIAQIGLRLLLSIIKVIPIESSHIFYTVQQSLKLTSELFGYNYNKSRNLV